MTSAQTAKSLPDDRAREIADELRRHVQGEVRFDTASRILYSTDASIYQMTPVGVVLPRTVDDVLASVDVAGRYGVPVLPRGGGTGLSGQTVNHAVVLDFSKYMRAIRDLRPEECVADVQPGIVLAHLSAAAAPHGLHFAPDPSTSNRGTIGGAIGNNSCGTHSVLFGKTSDSVLEVDAVLSDGTRATFKTLDGAALDARLALPGLEGHIYRNILRIARENAAEIEARYPKIQRRVSGYNLDAFTRPGPVNLAQMVVGSEGTLCVVTGARVKLEPRAKASGVVVATCSSLVQMGEATVAALEHQPAAVEFVDRMIMGAARRSKGLGSRLGFIQGDPELALLIELWGESPAEVRSRAERLGADLLGRKLADACVPVLDAAGQRAVWDMRRAGLGLLLSYRAESKPLPFVEDTAVDPSRLPDYLRRFDTLVREHGTTAAYYGHASVGCLHIRPLVDLKTQEGVDRMEAIAGAVADLVLEFGGSLSGEHGDGIVRGVFTERMFGPRLYQAFREVKRTFDPQGIMNPGKIIDCPPMTENLRYGPRYRALLPSRTYFDWSPDVSFGMAVEMCSGVGACRKVGEGTMCPSYMATREEQHSTRGRANTLRAMMSGQAPDASFTSDVVRDALDLCLECKACKTECETSVDMAKIKSEWLAHYHEQHPPRLRARIFANVHAVNQAMSRVAPLANLAMNAPVASRLGKRLLGIAEDRPMPEVRRETFQRWFRAHTPAGTGARGVVALMADTFTDFNNPEVGWSAVTALEKAGYRVVVPALRCCGRPMISKGFIEGARGNAAFNVQALAPYARAGIPVLGCEPSCLLLLRDEYPDLMRDPGRKAMARDVAARALLIDEFLLRESKRDGGLGLTFRTDLPKRKVLFHGHCHQKAIGDPAATAALLRMVPDLTVEQVSSGCCGMAGTFGYEAEHYEVSKAIGEERLFPAVRKDPEAEVAIVGVSCREQITHFTDRRPRHAIEVFAEALR